MAATRIIIRPNYLFCPRINFVLSDVRMRRKVHRPAIVRALDNYQDDCLSYNQVGF